MAGHSHWAGIKHKKGKADKQRSKIFSKLSKEITVAAKLGDKDPAMNPRLRSAIQAARSANMPKDNIERAIDKSSATTGSNFENLRYEGFGPDKIAVIVETLTDNKNRTASEIRSIFSKNGGNLGETGSVSFNFNKVGEIQVKKEIDDGALEDLLDHGLEDYNTEDDTTYIYCSYETLASLEKIMREKKFEIESANIIWKPNLTVNIEKEEELTKLVKLNDELEDNDDVQNCFSNLDFDSSLLEVTNA